MIKIFLTADNHFGADYGKRYGNDTKTKIRQSRMNAFENMVKKADEEKCDFFVVAGDLFNKTGTDKVPKRIIKNVVELLCDFSGEVIVMPGNHDHYTGDEGVWKGFLDEVGKTGKDNITLLNKFEPYHFNVGDEKIAFYPAYCTSNKSEENTLGWIKNTNIDTVNSINIGVAHGSIEDFSPDLKREYFYMTKQELEEIPVDAWLIGHTHIPYPDTLEENSDKTGYKIFNPGTHEQTDISNKNTDGNCFIISIDKQDGKACVSARKYISGKLHFHELEVHVEPRTESALADKLAETVGDIDKNSVLHINISGSVKESEYDAKTRESIYNSVLNPFIAYEIKDDNLSMQITAEMINKEFAETSFAAKFLTELDDPQELQMAYDLVKNCKEGR